MKAPREGRQDRPRVVMTLLLLAVANVGAAMAWPLTARFAQHHGEPGWQGWLYPAMSFGLALGASLFIAGERLAARRPPLWAWLTVAGALAVTGLMAAGQVTS